GNKTELITKLNRNFAKELTANKEDNNWDFCKSDEGERAKRALDKTADAIYDATKSKGNKIRRAAQNRPQNLIGVGLHALTTVQIHLLPQQETPATSLCNLYTANPTPSAPQRLLKKSMGDSQYSFSLTTFSPSGKLVQIEHALTAVGSGQTSLGIKAANGVVIATEKKLPSILVDETSVQKIQNLTPNIGVVYSGMGPDSRVLVRKSRKQAEQYFRLYKEPIPVTQLVRETATVMQEFTQSGGVRPFGVSLLVAGYDDKGPQLYQVDPSGSYFSWKASAMGKNVSNAKTFLEKRYTEDMELDDAVHNAILTLKEGFEGQISGKNIEIGVIGNDKIFKILTPSEIEDYLKEVE
ncbi:proteasome subunit alpha type, partial [Striga asiatica]